MSAFGINFIFEEDLNPDFPKWDFDDLSENSSLNAILQSTTLTRKFDKKDHVLNLSITNEKNKIRYDFNYHYVISNLNDFNIKMEEGIVLRLKNESIALLDRLYNIKSK